MPVSQKNTLGENLAQTLDIGNYTTNGQEIVSLNGNSFLNLRFANQDNFIVLANDNTGVLGAVVLNGTVKNTQISQGDGTIPSKWYIELDGDKGIGIRHDGVNAFSAVNAANIIHQPASLLVGGTNSILVVENQSQNRNSSSRLEAVFINTGQNPNLSTILQNVERTVIVGGQGITAKTDETLYCNQVSFQESGNLFDNIIVYPNSATQDNTHTLQNKSGTLAHVEDEFATTTVSPPVLAVDQNNYSPTGLSRNCWLRLDSSSPVNITGIDSTGFSDRDRIIVTNVGNSNLTFVGNSASSSVGNRFLSQSETLNNNGESIIMMFDATSNGWRLICLHI